MDVWQRYRMISKFNTNAMSHPLAEVTARQFEWRIRHPSPDRHFHNQAEVDDWLARPKPDDLYTVNDLHMPSGKPVVIHLRTEDVLHSFFIPDVRVKQDAVPGMVIPVWFDSVRSGHFDLVCAELCGWGHYKMRGRITSESEEEFKQHLAHLKASQNFDGVTAPALPAGWASTNEGAGPPGAPDRVARRSADAAGSRSIDGRERDERMRRRSRRQEGDCDKEQNAKGRAAIHLGDLRDRRAGSPNPARDRSYPKNRSCTTAGLLMPSPVPVE